MTEPEVAEVAEAGPVSESVDAPTDEVSFASPSRFGQRAARESAPWIWGRGPFERTSPCHEPASIRWARDSIANRESDPRTASTARSTRAVEAAADPSRRPPAS